jgi:hypothetical protein
VAIWIIVPAIGGDFDYQGWQVFIIVKITPTELNKQELCKTNSILREDFTWESCIQRKKIF